MVTLMTIPLFSNANYVQLQQISTKEGLNFQEISTIENYSDKCLWVGTDAGFNTISNGNIIPYSSIRVNDSIQTIGRVNDIACYSYSRTLIASENLLFEYDLREKLFRPIIYNGKDIITTSLLVSGNYAYFFESNTNSLLRYSFQTSIVSLVYKFDKLNHFLFTKILKPNNTSEDLLLLDNNKGLFKINLTNKEIKKIDIIRNPIVSKASIVDSENNLWIVYDKGGIEVFSIESGFSRIASYSKYNSKLDCEYITCMIELPDGDVYVGTDGYGLYIIKKHTGEVGLKTNPYFDESTSMCLIGHDVVFGTPYNGLIIARSSSNYMLNKLNMNDKNSLSNDVALSAYDDGDGIIWIGTAGGGINRYDEKADITISYNSTKNMRINSIKSFDKNRLLIGTVHNGYLLFDKNRGLISDSFMDVFKEFKYDLHNDSIVITPDNKGNYLVFNVEGNNYRFNPITGNLELFKLSSNEKTGIQEKVLKVMERSSYAIIATKRTIYKLDYTDLSSEPIYTTVNDYTTFTIDSKGLIWFIDSDELLSYDPEKKLISKVFSTSNGGAIVALTIDPEDNIWLSSIGGRVYRYRQDIGSYFVYFREDDIPEGNFLRSFAICSSTGRIYFPNTSGLLVIDTKELIERTQIARSIQAISIILDGESIPFPKKGKLTLPNGYKSFVMEMAVDTQDPTIPILMKLIMEKEGKEVSSKVTFQPVFNNTMLKAGKYRLKVQTLDITGWSEPITVLDLKVRAPLLFTGQVLIVLIILIGCSIWLIFSVRYNVKQRKIEQFLYEEATKQKESRISFMTNIAHELRTPLSLVYNPLKDIMNNKTPEDYDYAKLERIFSQIERMTNMVNMILESSSRSDFSLKNRVETLDINKWVSYKLIEFQEMCDRKRLEMKFEPDSTINKINIDLEVLETALDNVISNAIKYSDSGIITISIKQIQNYLRIAVADQGRGFKCNPEDLFKRFFRENNDVAGYGLGLSYTKTLLENIGGSISAEHNIDIGSIFNIDIPFEFSSDNLLSSYIEKVNEDTKKDEEQSESDSFNTKDKVLMFVDDDADLREYIKSEYQSLFKTVLVAKDGQIALEKIKGSLPDVIVSDIMMPNMNGFDLCKYIKSNIEYSHLPVILLTSRADSIVRMTSYKLGADAFLSKPFDFKELYKVIKNQLWNRYEIKRQYSQSLFFSMSEEQTFSAADEQFVLKLNKFINSNLSNLALDIEMISNHMNVSRSTLFNKMNELLGTSAVKYIRRLRVEAAEMMLENTDKSILDVALDCGFADGQYLSAVFKQETDETPSQYRKRARKEKML